MTSRRIVLLGPQRLAPTLRDAVASLGVHGRLATITAGWEEREGEDEELSGHLHGRTVNLNLFSRAEDVFRRDPELFERMKERHDTLFVLQELYRLRLAHALAAARELFVHRIEPRYGYLLEAEVQGAVESIRRLDTEHLERVRAVQVEFEERVRPWEREPVARHRAEIGHVLAECEGLCMAGGHVAILLNRLRLFAILDVWRERPIFAWSAGAMALAPRVVLFHDSPPQGAGNAEVSQPGLSAYSDLVALPHARRRLRLNDPVRVGLFARRFGPALCVALDERSRIDWTGEGWQGGPGARRLTPDGAVVEVA